MYTSSKSIAGNMQVTMVWTCGKYGGWEHGVGYVRLIKVEWKIEC